MAARNPNFNNLSESYLFPEIKKRVSHFLEKNPNTHLIKLGVGDTTRPIPGPIIDSFVNFSKKLGTEKGYRGYGPEQGELELRKNISKHFYQNYIDPDEVFISDGSKCDIGRLQILFGSGIKVAIQDPAYPVYVDGSLLAGVRELIFLPCLPENNFFPDLERSKEADLIYFCSPNNPTGATASYEQLFKLVQFAKKNGQIIIYDAAYAAYIQNSNLPKTIYEIPDAKEVAIETSSFSKIAGFTGVRLGWTIVPSTLSYSNGEYVQKDWKRVTSTVFNGASNIAQQGGIGFFYDQCRTEVGSIIQFYMKNVKILKEAWETKGFKTYGGTDAPYLWINFHHNSWDMFQKILENLHLVCTPGSGFGPSGEGFIRFTAFGPRDEIELAAQRIKESNFNQSYSQNI